MTHQIWQFHYRTKCAFIGICEQTHWWNENILWIKEYRTRKMLKEMICNYWNGWQSTTSIEFSRSSKICTINEKSCVQNISFTQNYSSTRSRLCLHHYFQDLGFSSTDINRFACFHRCFIYVIIVLLQFLLENVIPPGDYSSMSSVFGVRPSFFSPLFLFVFSNQILKLICSLNDCTHITYTHVFYFSIARKKTREETYNELTDAIYVFKHWHHLIL